MLTVNGNKTYRPEVWRRYRKYYRVDLFLGKLNAVQWAALFASMPWLLALLVILTA